MKFHTKQMLIMNVKDFFNYTFRLFVYFCLLLASVAFSGILYVYTYIVPELPDTARLKDVRMQIPLRIYTRDNAALAEFGTERRTLVSKEELPPLLVKAVIAIEDSRFYEHFGVDIKGLARAAVQLIKTGRKGQGASTITMQLVRNMFDEVGMEKTFERKFKEILVAIRVEQELEKDEILELYLNKIFLGHRAYGMASAAQVYYGKPLQELNLAQYAMLAGLPKAPSAYNPISNPQRALKRRNYILKRMLAFNFITDAEYQTAVDMPVSASRHRFSKDFDAPYIAEMVRMYMLENYPKDAYTGGYKVYTTIDTQLQKNAQQALRQTLLAYDTRHGYRGPIKQFDLQDFETELKEQNEALQEDLENPNDFQALNIEDIWLQVLKTYVPQVDLMPALILEVSEQSAKAFTREGEHIEIHWAGLSWARRYISDTRQTNPPKTATEILTAGDIVMVQRMTEEQADTTEEINEAELVTSADIAAAAQTGEEGSTQGLQWRLSQVPQVAGALVSLDSNTGSVLSLVGGFNYYHSKFNRIIQAKRQPGSNFKPFIYSAALENGYTPASIINDAPIVFYTDTKVWKPENYGHKFNGPTRLRRALAKSQNLVSIRLMQSMGVNKTLRYVSRFGFDPDTLPRNLTLSLGTPELTPLEVASGFAVFANGGYRVEPYFIEKIEDYNGRVIYQANPKVVCHSCNLPVDPPLEGEDGELAGLAGVFAKEEQQQKEQTLIQGSPDSPIFHPHKEELAELNTPRYAPRVIAAENAWLMTSMLKSVIKEGTGRRALRLQRNDLAGKTGTTNDQHDAWFSGFNHQVVTTAWVGFDQPKSLGKTVNGKETGASAALPMWMAYMQPTLQGQEETNYPMPAGIHARQIDPASGFLAYSGQENAMTEYFRHEHQPTRYAQRQPEQLLFDNDDTDLQGNSDQLF